MRLTYSKSRLKPVFHLATLFARCEAKTRIRHRDWLKLAGEKIRREQVGTVPTFLSVRANKFAKWKTALMFCGLSKIWLNFLIKSIVLSNFIYGISVYGTSDSDLTVVQKFLDRCYKRHYISEKVDVRELLRKTDIKLYNKQVLDKEQPLNNILPEKKPAGYNLRKENFLYPNVNTIRFKNTYVNRLISKYDI